MDTGAFVSPLAEIYVLFQFEAKMGEGLNAICIIVVSRCMKP